MFKQQPILGIVVPCYNEEEVLELTVVELDAVLAGLEKEGLVSPESFILFVNDGSRDRTWPLIADLKERYRRVSGLNLAGNVGHQSALLGGLMTARRHADCLVSIDADLQDDVRVIRDMVLRYREGCDIVYGVRSSRQRDTWFKRTTAEGFYKVMEGLGLRIVNNHADYRLMSRRALDELSRFSEVNIFLRGMVPMLGYQTGIVYYERLERAAGESKYPLKKMISFALEGITSLSVKPIRMVTAAGFAVFAVSIVMAIYGIVSNLTGRAVSGWSSLIVSLWFIGGVQLLSIGLIGEYIGKIYREVKRRPLYIVERELPPAVRSGAGAGAVREQDEAEQEGASAAPAHALS
ncbi:glycosyltransferase family 2 protein [Paenibacillus pasadenensis]|uniref:glycosyltransferase family 2 protein n=1 Tax=Paenibacillus pasadenensis TaxID=217090 RepID=UPI00040015BB|nr:glycosyltransferase family 2 protein [Paenibacillus pasadenensis]